MESLSSSKVHDVYRRHVFKKLRELSMYLAISISFLYWRGITSTRCCVRSCSCLDRMESEPSKSSRLILEEHTFSVGGVSAWRDLMISYVSDDRGLIAGKDFGAWATGFLAYLIKRRVSCDILERIFLGSRLFLELSWELRRACERGGDVELSVATVLDEVWVLSSKSSFLLLLQPSSRFKNSIRLGVP